jgi:hypothetical protein
MSTQQPHLHATLAAGKEVRHLLIDFIDGSRITNLVQLSAGSETHLATGTEHEIGQKAEEFVRLWTAEGFKRHSPNDAQDLVYEPLERTVAFAKRMGFTSLYDSNGPRSINFAGVVPLEEWRGVTPKLAGSYDYALGRLQIHARPLLPANHPLAAMSAPTDVKGLAAYLSNYTKVCDEVVGPFRDFLLEDIVLFHDR